MTAGFRLYVDWQFIHWSIHILLRGTEAGATTTEGSMLRYASRIPGSSEPPTASGDEALPG